MSERELKFGDVVSLTHGYFPDWRFMLISASTLPNKRGEWKAWPLIYIESRFGPLVVNLWDDKLTLIEAAP